MRATYAIFKNDLRLQTKTLPLFAAAAVFLALSGYFFFWEINYFSVLCFRLATDPELAGRGFNLTESMISTFFMNMAVLLLLLLPALTGRAFSGERKEGTLELLFTFPVSDGELLWGKFLAAWASAVFLFAPSVAFVVIARINGASLDGGVIFSAYLGLILLSGALVSLGLLASLWTTHALAGAAVSFGVLLILWAIGWGADQANPFWSAVLTNLSLFDHFRRFTKGVIHIGDAVYFMLFIAFFLMMTREGLGARRWAR